MHIRPLMCCVSQMYGQERLTNEEEKLRTVQSQKANLERELNSKLRQSDLLTESLQLELEKRTKELQLVTGDLDRARADLRRDKAGPSDRKVELERLNSDIMRWVDGG